MKRPHPCQLPKVKMNYSLACYTSNCNFNVKFYNRSSVLRRSVTLNWRKWKFLNFVIFAYNMLWPFFMIWPEFPKYNNKNYFLWAFTGQAIPVIFYIFFKKIITTHSTFLSHSYIALFNLNQLLSILYHIYYQCLS